MATLPSHILKALRDNKTSLGEHPCFPPEEEEKFIIGLLSKTFKEINEKVIPINISHTAYVCLWRSDSEAHSGE